MHRSWEWFSPPTWRRYATIVLAAIVVNAAVEWLSVGWLGLWGYSSRHPVVAGVGLVAVLQALVMPPLTFALLARWGSPRDGESERDAEGSCEG